nr:PREDICTED: chitinase domain-containing protein 1-like isoform X1 [Nicotiana tabacum]
MAKKRSRQGGPSSSHRSERVESSSQNHRTHGSVKSHTNRHRWLTTFCILFVAIFVLIYRQNYYFSTTVRDGGDSNRPYVHQRGLVKTDLTYREILTENSKVSENISQRYFRNPVLAYITPWNSKGYDLAKKFSSKITHLSPVWYELKNEGSKLVLNGRHNADRGWISDIRMKGNSLILPRVVLEAIPVDLLKKKRLREKAINLIITECKELEYDGIVLESWSRWVAYGILHDSDKRNMALKFIKQLGEAMHSVHLERNGKTNLQLVYVIGPPRTDKLQEHDFGPEDLQALSDAVDGFSLMTYDYSSPYNPGPNAPLKWIRSTLHLLAGAGSKGRRLAEKIFVGINFYGNDFVLSKGLGGGPIISHEYLSLLEEHKPLIQWEEDSAEHFFLYSDNQQVQHAVFYPSLMSLAVRLEEALSWGAGISIWEIGQGLEYFFDIL